MPTPRWSPPDLKDLIKSYHSGVSVMRLAESLGCSAKAVTRVLRENGVEIRRPNAPWFPEDPAGVIERYRDGESVKAIADQYGISRTGVTRWLQEQQVNLRTQTEANQLMVSQRTPEQNAANTAAAHAAVRGTTQSLECRTRMAKSKEASGRGASPSELLLCEWLSDLEPVPQKAIGPYNTDIAIGTIAVEIFGGHWHGHGRHAARTADRARFILNEGWLLLIVWVTRRHNMTREVAGYIRDLNQQVRADPSLNGQYRVVWGDGKDMTAGYAGLDQLSIVPADGPRRGRKVA